jgi:hypothetical protein
MIPTLPEWVFRWGFRLACVGALAVAAGVIALIWWAFSHLRWV